MISHVVFLINNESLADKMNSSSVSDIIGDHDGAGWRAPGQPQLEPQEPGDQDQDRGEDAGAPRHAGEMHNLDSSYCQA